MAKKTRLLGIADVSCDYKGAIEFLTKFTEPDKPFFMYDPISEKIVADDIIYKPGQLLY